MSTHDFFKTARSFWETSPGRVNSIVFELILSITMCAGAQRTLAGVRFFLLYILTKKTPCVI